MAHCETRNLSGRTLEWFVQGKVDTAYRNLLIEASSSIPPRRFRRGVDRGEIPDDVEPAARDRVADVGRQVGSGCPTAIR